MRENIINHESDKQGKKTFSSYKLIHAEQLALSFQGYGQQRITGIDTKTCPGAEKGAKGAGGGWLSDTGNPAVHGKNGKVRPGEYAENAGVLRKWAFARCKDL